MRVLRRGPTEERSLKLREHGHGQPATLTHPLERHVGHGDEVEYLPHGEAG